MATHGEKLKETRLKQGKSIHDVAQLTRISAQFLEAIESNQLEKIPGDFFRRSFIRQYASALGLNPDEFQPERSMEFRSLGGRGEEAGPVQFHQQPDLPPLPPAGRRRPFAFRQVLLSFGLLIGVLAICAVAYTLWEDYQLGRDRQDSSIQSTPPSMAGVSPSRSDQAVEEDSSAPTENELPPPAEPSSSSSATAQVPEAKSPATRDVDERSSPVADSTESGSGTAQVATAESPSNVYGSGSRELRLSASAPTWVQAREGERTLFVGVISPGQTRVLRLNDGARLVVGNAGGLSVNWQGEEVGTVGPLGQVRIVTVTPDGVSVSSPVRNTPAPSES